MSVDAAKPLWSLDVPTLEHSIGTDLAAAGPVSLLFAGIAAGCAPGTSGCKSAVVLNQAQDTPTYITWGSYATRYSIPGRLLLQRLFDDL